MLSQHEANSVPTHPIFASLWSSQEPLGQVWLGTGQLGFQGLPGLHRNLLHGGKGRGIYSPDSLGVMDHET